MTARRLAPLLCALALGACARPAAAQPPMWIVRDADSQIVLFGSLHLLPQGADWRPLALTEAVHAADDLWFELPLDSGAVAALQRRVQELGVLPPGETLSPMLSKAGRERLTRIARKVGVPMSAIDRLQPWYAETALGVAVYRQQGVVSEEGVERQLADQAPASARLRAFETADQQIALFAGAPRADQLRSLESSLKELEEDEAFAPRLIGFWLTGDVKGLDRMAVAKLRHEDPAQYKRLILERNRAWLTQIEARMAGSGRTVMVVGVGHLVGRDGLPAALRARGYKVEGP